MRPILLKGHERPITHLKYNRESDLLFTCSKDSKPNVWFASNGDRLGTYNGHEGAVSELDVNFNSTLLLTGSADTTARFWDVQTGKCKFVFKHKAPVRSVCFSEGDQTFLSVGDKALGQEATIFIYPVAEDEAEQSGVPVQSMVHTTKINQAIWGPLNQTIIAACDDGSVTFWDVESGEMIHSLKHHSKSVNSIQLSPDRSMFITASTDQSAKLYDTRSFELIKTFEADRPLNSAAISPFYHHVIAGGGQDAASVTTTASRSGKFESCFFSIVYAELLGTLKGHFGPINALAFSPDGKSFATGAEDGFIRLTHFDPELYKTLQRGDD